MGLTRDNRISLHRRGIRFHGIEGPKGGAQASPWVRKVESSSGLGREPAGQLHPLEDPVNA
jgi:hypothetical protein